MIATLIPRLFNNRPIDAVVIPLPIEETTPPVTKIYFGRVSPVPVCSPRITPASNPLANYSRLHRAAELWFQNHDLHRLRQIALTKGQLLLRLGILDTERLAERCKVIEA